MKKIYTVLAAVVAAFAASGAAFAADAGDAANVQVLWRTVNINRDVNPVVATVTAQIAVNEGKTFDAEVYPVMFSQEVALDYGEGTGQLVQLPASGRSETSLLTWTFNLYTSMLRPAYPKMLCILYFKDGIGKAVELSRVEVNSSGTTGITDAVADNGGVTEVFDITGVRVAGGDSVDLGALGRGVYIVRTGTTVSKIVR